MTRTVDEVREQLKDIANRLYDIGWNINTRHTSANDVWKSESRRIQCALVSNARSLVSLALSEDIDTDSPQRGDRCSF